MKTKKAENMKTKTDQDHSIHTKSSFEPVSRVDTRVLIFGSMPGDRSIELGEYYGHARNRFWKIIATITNQDLPKTYDDKKDLLFKARIGVWDIVRKANRKGSLDSAIEDEEPNDIMGFIEKHKHLKVIAFNGKKSEALYDKYFDRKPNITYISLPSSSPANAGIGFESICEKWREIWME